VYIGTRRAEAVSIGFAQLQRPAVISPETLLQAAMTSRSSEEQHVSRKRPKAR
jgi:hypothetical protein